MPFTAPFTGTVGQNITAAQWNLDVRDNTNWLNAAHAARAFKSATQSVTVAGSPAVVSFDSEDYDSDAIHDTVTNNSRMTVPTSMDGKWFFMAYADLPADASDHNGSYVLFLRKNGVTTMESKAFRGHLSAQCGMIAGSWPLVATDYMEVLFTSNTQTRVLQASTSGTSFLAIYLGS